MNLYFPTPHGVLITKNGESLHNFLKNDLLLPRLSLLLGYNCFIITSCFSEVLHNLDKVEPIYTDFDGWENATNGIENFTDLPENAKKYIKYISNFIETPINIISTGPGRNQIIKL